MCSKVCFLILCFVFGVWSKGDLEFSGDVESLESEEVVDGKDPCREERGARVCNGRGTCVDGSCECLEISPGTGKWFSGSFCECDDYACDYSNNKLCGGPERGTCKCNQCQCKAGFTGSGCECPTSTDGCMASNGEVCNWKGTCECGRCRCDWDYYYYGRTCEDCPTCRGPCERAETCIVCLIDETEDCSKECANIPVISPEEVPVGTLTEKPCVFSNTKGSKRCLYHYLESSPELHKNVYVNVKCEDVDDVDYPEEVEKYNDMCRQEIGGPVCDNHGTCALGECHCDQAGRWRRYYGRYCECLDTCSCGRHGKCKCNKCECEAGFTGERCECPLSTDGCMANNGELCNGQGTCECGQCICDNDSSFSGKTCEECPTCLGPCERAEACIVCMIDETSDCSKDCENISVFTLADIPSESTYQGRCVVANTEETKRCEYHYGYIPELQKTAYMFWLDLCEPM